MNNKTLFIKKVERCPASQMAMTEQIQDIGIRLNGCSGFENLCIIGLASVDIATKVENKQRIFTAKLEFKTIDDPGNDRDKYCYLLTDVTGRRFLIGTGERPYPMLSTSELAPNTPAGKSGCTCTVTYTNLFGPLSVLG